MKIRVLTTTTLFALLAAPAWAQPQETGTAQEAATTQDLPDARTVIDRYLELTGADKAINDSTSTRTKGTMEVVGMGLSGPMEILSHKSNKVAVQIEMGAMGPRAPGLRRQHGLVDPPDDGRDDPGRVGALADGHAGQLLGRAQAAPGLREGRDGRQEELPGQRLLEDRGRRQDPRGCGRREDQDRAHRARVLRRRDRAPGRSGEHRRLADGRDAHRDDPLRLQADGSAPAADDARCRRWAARTSRSRPSRSCTTTSRRRPSPCPRRSRSRSTRRSRRFQRTAPHPSRGRERCGAVLVRGSGLLHEVQVEAVRRVELGPRPRRRPGTTPGSARSSPPR